jgi:NodT family efflux transporter outer membrane factor (OMF) lipoprotein
MLTTCSVGPDYVTPDAPTEAAYKEAATPQPGWTTATPEDAAARGQWWAIYNDPLLNDLEAQVSISNQTLKESEAQYRQAQAAVELARSAYFPTVSVNGAEQFSHNGGSGRGSVTGSSSTTVSSASSTAQGGTVNQGNTIITGSTGGGGVTRTFDLSAGATWEIDVWGRIRRQVEENVDLAQASAADLALARLSEQATLATAYFNLRYEDQLAQLLGDTVKAYQQSLTITENQYKAGVVAKADVITARTQLEQTQSQLINIGVARAQYEHAIAVLVGKTPAEFSLAPAPAPLTADIPVVPAEMPATLLQRRPDVAAAERQVAAENAAVGVAIAAFYPDITLSGNVGYTNNALTNLFSSQNQDWSLGPSIAETVFDAGARSAQVEEARALFDQQIAVYRQTVLTAFQQVEDNLAAQRILNEQAKIQNQAVADAEESVKLTLNQYKAGIIVYTNVLVAQETALSNEETALALRQSRLNATVALIQALGGGWDTTQLPTHEQVEDPTLEGHSPDACDFLGFVSRPACWFR